MWLAPVVTILTICPLVRASSPPGFDAESHMRVDEVQDGMRGYGLTVFAGTRVEPFPVEVISVEHGFEPGKAVVWIRCPGDRLQTTGPIQGMSGSPIYLWPESAGQDGDGSHELGQGGKLLGAFAFGYTRSKNCYGGVQPIEQMLRGEARADERPKRASTDTRKALRASLSLARSAPSSSGGWRGRALARLLGVDPEEVSTDPAQARPEHLAVPVTVPSTRLAKLLKPYFRRLGLTAVGRPDAAGSTRPPSWIDPKEATLEPGSVLSVPLVRGPMQLAASGTVTAVLPNGHVLGFGHAFFGRGDVSLPMAPGFVHYVQPSLDASFKLTGAFEPTGAIVHDEQTGIVGEPKASFPTAKVQVHLKRPSAGLDRTFDYTVTHHPRLIGSLVSSSLIGSLTSDMALPIDNTLRVAAELQFSNGRKLRFTHTLPDANPRDLMMDLEPVVTSLTENRFGPTRLEKAKTTVTVKTSVDRAEVVNASLRKSPVAPGDRVTVDVTLKPFRHAPREEQLVVEVPEETKKGTYEIIVGGAKTYFRELLRARQHLARIGSEEDLYDAVRRLYTLEDEAVYGLLRLRRGDDLAVGQRELPSLPSAQKALLSAESSTATRPYVKTATAKRQLPFVVADTAELRLRVRPDNGE